MNFYLNKFVLRNQLIKQSVPDGLGIIVVIPCYNETELLTSLQSLNNCKLPSCNVEVITVINSSENSSDFISKQNLKTKEEATEWINNHSKAGIDFYIIEENNLPKKDAGVGLARKIGMDEAVRRFEAINNHKGVIVCFDADSKCEKNYLIEIEKHFNNNVKTPACSIHFEHPLNGKDYPDYIYKGIEEYELHLRYYKNGLQYCGLPYAFHTIGSSMAVRSSAYQKQNGMNKRKAGEDFYFLQKLIPLGNFTELNTTKVIPSPRVSDRVPFGTGKAMQNYKDNNFKGHLSYNIKSFVDLKLFCEQIPILYNNEKIDIPESVAQFLKEIDFENNLEKIKKNSPNQTHFLKLFYNWFNAFKVLKFMHFARDHFYPDVSVYDMANELLILINKEKQPNENLIYFFRELDN